MWYVVFTIISFLAALFIHMGIGTFRRSKVDKDGVLHIKPSNYLYNYIYNYKWADTTKCDDCNTIGMYEDCHPINPCSECGGNVREHTPMKFNYKIGLWERRVNND